MRTSKRQHEQFEKEAKDDRIGMLQNFKLMVQDIKKSIMVDIGGKVEDLESRHILLLEKKVDNLRSKLIVQGLKQLCRCSERKNRLNLRYFLRKAFKAK